MEVLAGFSPLHPDGAYQALFLMFVPSSGVTIALKGG